MNWTDVGFENEDNLTFADLFFYRLKMQNFFLKALNFKVSVSSMWPLRKRPVTDGIHSSVEPLNLEAEHKSVMGRQEWKVDTLCDLYETLTITQAIIYCSSLAKSYWGFFSKGCLQIESNQFDYSIEML